MSTYDATVDGVRGFVPHRAITETSKPSEADVRAYITHVGALVAARIGPPASWTVDDLTRGTWTDAVRGLVELGAAAMTDDASFPERASTVGESRYGAVLWQRFREGLDELAGVLNPDKGVPGPGVVSSSTGRPAATLRPALFTRATAW